MNGATRMPNLQATELSVKTMGMVAGVASSIMLANTVLYEIQSNKSYISEDGVSVGVYLTQARRLQRSHSRNVRLPAAGHFSRSRIASSQLRRTGSHTSMSVFFPKHLQVLRQGLTLQERPGSKLILSILQRFRRCFRLRDCCAKENV